MGTLTHLKDNVTLLLLIAAVLMIIGIVRLLGQALNAAVIVLAIVFASITVLLTSQMSQSALSLRYFVWAVLASAFWGMAIGGVRFFRREINDAWAVSEAGYESAFFAEEAWQE
jgi:hypothetical protein